MNVDKVTYFENFGVEHIPKEIKIHTKNILTNIYRIQAYNSIMRVTSTNAGISHQNFLTFNYNNFFHICVKFYAHT